ncbi:MAG: type VI secretion system contractile sheath small subunit [Geobacteraceae bacterium]|nr:type VI secretion system contractile sheath small subunit [Geobacteraceae bacterium]
MAKESSIAPKERVNIVYRPSLGNAQEEVELPLKMLVLGDFTGSPDDRPLEKREPVNVDKDNFNEVLKAQNITLNFSVPNRLAADEGDELNVKLRMESLKDFGPEAVVDQVPELKRLLELREALRALKGPLSNVPEFRKKIQELIKDDTTRQRLLTEIGLEG